MGLGCWPPGERQLHDLLVRLAVQTIPWCDQTGFIHFHSSVISGSASRINARMRARVSPAPSLQVVDPLVDELGRGLLDRGSPRLLSCRHVQSSASCDAPLRHLMAYGSTNMYRPVNRSKASGNSGE